MRKVISIFLLLIFTNLTLSPVTFNSAMFGTLTEERNDTEERGDDTMEEDAHKTFCSFNVIFNLLFHPEDVSFKSTETDLLSVYIERPAQPPDQLV